MKIEMETNVKGIRRRGWRPFKRGLNIVKREWLTKIWLNVIYFFMLSAKDSNLQFRKIYDLHQRLVSSRKKRRSLKKSFPWEHILWSVLIKLRSTEKKVNNINI